METSDKTKWLTLGEAARILGVHQATLRTWANDDKVSSTRTPGGHRRFREDDIYSFVNETKPDSQDEETGSGLSADVEIIIQSAMGRARMNMEQLQKLSWYNYLDSNAQTALRRQGQSVLRTLWDYLLDKESDEESALSLGRSYADVLINSGLLVTEALEGFQHFSDMLTESVLLWAELRPRRVEEWSEMLRRVNQFNHAMLRGIMLVYQKQTSSR